MGMKCLFLPQSHSSSLKDTRVFIRNSSSAQDRGHFSSEAKQVFLSCCILGAGACAPKPLNYCSAVNAASELQEPSGHVLADGPSAQ